MTIPGLVRSSIQECLFELWRTSEFLQVLVELCNGDSGVAYGIMLGELVSKPI